MATAPALEDCAVRTTATKRSGRAARRAAARGRETRAMARLVQICVLGNPEAAAARTGTVDSAGKNHPSTAASTPRSAPRQSKRRRDARRDVSSAYGGAGPLLASGHEADKWHERETVESAVYRSRAAAVETEPCRTRFRHLGPCLRISAHTMPPRLYFSGACDALQMDGTPGLLVLMHAPAAGIQSLNFAQGPLTGCRAIEGGHCCRMH